MAQNWQIVTVAIFVTAASMVDSIPTEGQLVSKMAQCKKYEDQLMEAEEETPELVNNYQECIRTVASDALEYTIDVAGAWNERDSRLLSWLKENAWYECNMAYMIGVGKDVIKVYLPGRIQPRNVDQLCAGKEDGHVIYPEPKPEPTANEPATTPTAPANSPPQKESNPNGGRIMPPPKPDGYDSKSSYYSQPYVSGEELAKLAMECDGYHVSEQYAGAGAEEDQKAMETKYSDCKETLSYKALQYAKSSAYKAMVPLETWFNSPFTNNACFEPQFGYRLTVRSGQAVQFVYLPFTEQPKDKENAKICTFDYGDEDDDDEFPTFKSSYLISKDRECDSLRVSKPFWGAGAEEAQEAAETRYSQCAEELRNGALHLVRVQAKGGDLTTWLDENTCWDSNLRRYGLFVKSGKGRAMLHLPELSTKGKPKAESCSRWLFADIFPTLPHGHFVSADLYDKAQECDKNRVTTWYSGAGAEEDQDRDEREHRHCRDILELQADSFVFKQRGTTPRSAWLLKNALWNDKLKKYYFIVMKGKATQYIYLQDKRVDMRDTSRAPIDDLDRHFQEITKRVLGGK